MVDALILVGTGIRGYEVSGPEEEKIWDEFDAKMKPQEEAIRDKQLEDAVRMDVNTWAAVQKPEPRQRILEIAMDNADTQSEPPGKLQVSATTSLQASFGVQDAYAVHRGRQRCLGHGIDDRTTKLDGAGL